MKLKFKNLYNINVGNLLILSILLGFTFNAPIQYCCNSIRVTLLILFIFLAIYTVQNDIKKNRYIQSYIFLMFIGCLGLISLSITQADKVIAIRELYLPVSIILGFFSFRYYDKFKYILIFMIYLNLLSMIYDVTMGEYLFELGADIGNAYQSVRAKGLFGYSKEAGAFLIFATLIFRKDSIFLLSVLLISSIMSGSRTPMIFVGIILCIEIIIYIKNNISIKSILLVTSLVF